MHGHFSAHPPSHQAVNSCHASCSTCVRHQTECVARLQGFKVLGLIVGDCVRNFSEKTFKEQLVVFTVSGLSNQLMGPICLAALDALEAAGESRAVKGK